jgi:predicted metal-binding protein
VAYEKWSGRKLYNWLKFDINFRTANGKKGIALGNIYLILQNPFYYGVFEYPLKSGNWYTGKHEPIIDKELFDMVQQQIKSQVIKSEGKEFAFTKLMTCGLCGSGISADEKFKKLKSGEVNRHVYYFCNKSKDRNCKCGYINEDDLLKQFEQLIDNINLDEVGIKEKIRAEIERFKKFQRMISGNNDDVKVNNVDIRNYAKYILREGSILEKRELLERIKTRIILKNREITIEKVVIKS